MTLSFSVIIKEKVYFISLKACSNYKFNDGLKKNDYLSNIENFGSTQNKYPLRPLIYMHQMPAIFPEEHSIFYDYFISFSFILHGTQITKLSAQI
jgi:hypothetical protein